MRLLGVLLAATFVLGCGKHESHTVTTSREEGHGHSHERDKLLLRDLGPYHAGLTAHLSSKTGNELDVFIETADAAHTPVPLPILRFSAKASVAGAKGERELMFEPAEMDERKDDPPGKCSHFVAKAPWIEPDVPLTLTVTIEVNGKPEVVQWRDFLPKKYAHHIE